MTDADASHTLPPVRATSIRLDDATYAAVQEACTRDGMSVSEYIRQAVNARLAWHTAIEMARTGAPPDVLLDFEALAEALREVTRRRSSP